MTDSSQLGYYSVSFPPDGQHALLTNQGPGVPHTSLIALTEGGLDHIVDIETNLDLMRKTQTSISLILQRHFFHIDLGTGAPLPFMELLPPTFYPSRRYPVIFHVYGGPGSQTTSQKFKVDYQSFLASQNYVVVTIDGRGTGFNGGDVRCIVQDHLGYYEAMD
jgi:dipeptidyl aminopeptidase